MAKIIPAHARLTCAPIYIVEPRASPALTSWYELILHVCCVFQSKGYDCIEGHNPGRVMDVAKYVAHGSVGRFSHELENAADDTRRAMLLRLLVEEENKVGLTYEQLAETLRQIGHANQIISTQLEIIAMLKAAGHSMERAECNLANAVHLLAAHEAYRAKIEAALYGLKESARSR